MFRMEFQSLDPVDEADEPERGTSVYEQFRQNRAAESEASPPKIYEGRVGRFEKMQRVASSNHAVNRSVADLPSVLSRSASTNDSLPKNFVAADLIDLGSPKGGGQQASEPDASADLVVIRELVKPFAESVNINDDSSVQSQPAASWDLLTDGVQAVEAAPESPLSTASLQLRTNSMRSTSSTTSFSDTSDAESSSFRASAGEKSHVKDEEKGSPVARAYNRAFSKIMHKKSKPPTQDARKVAKPWDEPLLADHDQAKLERKQQKAAKKEAERLAAEAERDAEIQQLEFLALANPVPESALNNTLKKDHGVRKGIHKLFHIHGGTHSNPNSPRDAATGDVRESKLVLPRKGLIESPLAFRSPTATTAEIALSHIRTAPRPTSRKDMTFATVESNQRDVPPWTMEEYMARNARKEEWEKREDDEEFGGIEGNQLMNQYFDDDIAQDQDSDSD